MYSGLEKIEVSLGFWCSSLGRCSCGASAVTSVFLDNPAVFVLGKSFPSENTGLDFFERKVVYVHGHDKLLISKDFLKHTASK